MTVNHHDIVEVTEADILNGKQSSMYECPIAHALKRLYPLSHPLVGRHHIRLMGIFTAVPSRRMERWIRQFDLGKPTYPARFLVKWE